MGKALPDPTAVTYEASQMAYNHLDIVLEQSPKREGAPCGDVAAWERTPSGTLIVLADGLGKGAKAHVVAHMFVSRLMELCRRGASVREAFRRVATTINANRMNDGPYSAFALVWIRSDGDTTILTYDLPEAVLFGRQTASILKGRSLNLGDAVAMETVCLLEPGDSLMFVSDGITQAGMGRVFPMGWTIERVERDIEYSLSEGMGPTEIARYVHEQARAYWGAVQGDDCSVLVATMRPGKVVHLLTGPPSDRNDDYEVVNRFMSAEGTHVVCGGSTTSLAARVLNTRARLIQNEESWGSPPEYRVEGVDLATEGVVTLTQVCRILNENPKAWERSGPVSALARLLLDADKVEITVGCAMNPASGDISFTKQGIMPRTTLAKMLRDILEKMGKLVVMHWC